MWQFLNITLLNAVAMVDAHGYDYNYTQQLYILSAWVSMRCSLSE